MSSVHLDKLKKKYKIIYLHNPKHFYLNNLWIEDKPNGDKLLCANARLSRNNRKNFHVLALLKKKVKPQELAQQNVLPSSKPFNGIFQD